MGSPDAVKSFVVARYLLAVIVVLQELLLWHVAGDVQFAALAQHFSLMASILLDLHLISCYHLLIL
jgi:hypothetical protein